MASYDEIKILLKCKKHFWLRKTSVDNLKLLILYKDEQTQNRKTTFYLINIYQILVIVFECYSTELPKIFFYLFNEQCLYWNNLK